MARSTIAKAHLAMFCSLAGILIAGCSSHKYTYPSAQRGDVVEDHFGVKVADPYRWLEEDNSPQTRDWIERQNQATQSFVAGPTRDRIRARLAELYNYPRYTVPLHRGEYYFYSKNDGLQNQSVLYGQKGLSGEAFVVLDPNKLSTDGTVSLGTAAFSHDGTLLAYGIQRSGSDNQELRVLSVADGKAHEDVLQWCKFANVAWKHDNSGFFYNRYPDPATVAKGNENCFNRVYWHKLGTPQSQDQLVYEDASDKRLSFGPGITEDGKYLIVSVHRGTDPTNRLYYRPIDGDGPLVKLIDTPDARYSFVENVGETFYIHTNLDAPRGRVIAIDTRRPDRANWKEIIPQKEQVLSRVEMAGDQLVAVYMQDASHRLYMHKLDGQLAREIALPGLGTVSVSAQRDDKEMFLGFASFTTPLTVYRCDVASGKLVAFREPKLTFDPAAYTIEQVFYASRDGTRVPMFVVHKKGLSLDGTNPTILYGYGGFNISVLPAFNPVRIAWLENGGVFAVANLRGGEEYGEQWHKAGMLGNKQNVFDDFIAAGQYLVEHRYTNPKKLAINGGSNGGLLVAACLVQRPDLFGAAVANVPVTDMLRYHKWTVGAFWMGEYGNPDDPQQFKFLYAYSPLHNLKPGTAYPPTLITTADTDDRVVPAHSRKFTAALQAASNGSNPILLRIETKAGHGGGKPISKSLDEQADIYSFYFKVLGIPLPPRR